MPLDYDDDPPTGRTLTIRAGGSPALEQLHRELRGLEAKIGELDAAIEKHTETSARFQGGAKWLGGILLASIGMIGGGVWWVVEGVFESRRVASEHEIRINAHDDALESAAGTSEQTIHTVSAMQVDMREIRTIVQSMDNRLERIEHGLDGRNGR